MNLTKTFSTRVLLTAILAAASFATHASSTDEQGAVVRVRYDDLNLTAPAGVASLKRRVSKAAEQVCATQYESDRVGRNQKLSCVRRATDKALAQVKWPEK